MAKDKTPDQGKAGRPELPDEDKRTERVYVTVTKGEMAQFQAKAGDEKVSKWARETLLSDVPSLLAEAEKELQQIGSEWIGHCKCEPQMVKEPGLRAVALAKKLRDLLAATATSSSASSTDVTESPSGPKSPSPGADDGGNSEAGSEGSAEVAPA